MTGWLDEAFIALNIDKAHIVGHSMGAKIALGFVLSHSHRVVSLSLISPAGLGGEFHHETLDTYLNAQTKEACEDLARHLLGPAGQNLVPALTNALFEAAREPQRAKALLDLLGNAKTYGLALSPEGFDWSHVRCPVQILWGDHDRLIPVPEAHRLPKSAAFHLISGAGHLPHMETSAAVVAQLKAFLP